MKQHCYCNMLNPRQGGMVTPEDTTYVRDGVPLCAEICVIRYEKRRDQRELVEAMHVAGQVNGVKVT